MRKKEFSLPLVNAHTHAAMVAFRGVAEDLPLNKWLEEIIWPQEREKITPSFIYRESKKAIREMKKNGIKVFSDMYFFSDEVAKAAKELSMIAVIGEGIMDFPSPSYKNSEEALYITENLIKKYQRDPWIKVAVAPHSIYTASTSTLIKAKKLARKYKTIYHLHLAETKKEITDCQKKHHCTPVEYLEKIHVLDSQTILAHAVWLTDKDIAILAKRKVHVVHCPLSNLKLGSGIAPIAKLIEKGINVTLGTDGAASSNRLDIWEAGKYAALLQKGINQNPTCLPAKKVIEMMTINGLRALGFTQLANHNFKNIEETIAQEKNFNFLYELHSHELRFI